MARSAPPRPRDDLVTGEVALKVAGEPMAFALTVPAGPARPEELLPALREVTGAMVERGVRAVEREGKAISCRAGCGACCRQLVPVAGGEARMLARLVDAMPPPRRARVRARFAAALAALEAADLLERLADPTGITGEVGMAYLRLGLPCPFLEDESCSIHPDRPLGCREYLVTSLPERCADTEARDIAMVPIAWKVSHSLYRAVPADGWLPLVLALRFAERPAPPPRPGPALLRDVFRKGPLDD